MVPLLDDSIHTDRNSTSNKTASRPRIAIIGAGSRGDAYARATVQSGLGIVVAVVEPIEYKRNLFGSKYIWHKSKPYQGQSFETWQDFISFEQQRQQDEAAGIPVPHGVNGVFICVRDELHVDVVTAFAPLGLHIMCEKPLATTLKDCLRIQDSLQSHPQKVFAVGHVLRYSPHNMMLRDLVLNQKVIGDVVSIEHTEPVGWWHFTHSYVRGNWRKESVTAPSLLTKSCHDIDWLLWMLCSPPANTDLPPHSPSSISSMGSLKLFKKSRKPSEAGAATNCLSCPIKEDCMYSAENIYYHRHLAKGNTHWPVDIVRPDIEDILTTGGLTQARKALLESLAEDYDANTVPREEVEQRSWFGRCVWESDNDVCDDQHVTIEWEDDEHGRTSKTASFHMIAHTQNICERRGRIYGTAGEISHDSNEIVIHDFKKDHTLEYRPEVPADSHHGGGDSGLTQQFLKAVAAVSKEELSVQEAQVKFLGVTVEEAVRSHAVCFAAEDARKQARVIDWTEWWESNAALHVDRTRTNSAVSSLTTTPTGKRKGRPIGSKDSPDVIRPLRVGP